MLHFPLLVLLLLLLRLVSSITRRDAASMRSCSQLHDAGASAEPARSPPHPPYGCSSTDLVATRATQETEWRKWTDDGSRMRRRHATDVGWAAAASPLDSAVSSVLRLCCFSSLPTRECIVWSSCGPSPIDRLQKRDQPVPRGRYLAVAQLSVSFLSRQGLIARTAPNQHHWNTGEQEAADPRDTFTALSDSRA